MFSSSLFRRPSTSAKKSFLILGCGVSGLTTALALYSHFPNAQITLIGHKTLLSTVSMVAGASFFPTLAKPKDQVNIWSKDSFAFFRALESWSQNNLQHNSMKTHFFPGISWIKGRVFEKSYQIPDPPWWSKNDSTPKFSISETRTKSNGFSWVYKFSTLSMDTTHFLPWLFHQVKQFATIFVSPTKFTSVGQAIQWYERKKGTSKKFDAVILCTALGTNKIKDIKDPHPIFPVRGQVVVVPMPFENPPKSSEWTYWKYNNPEENINCYIIPRPFSNQLIIGGTQQFGKYLDSIDPQICPTVDSNKKIHKKHKKQKQQGKLELLPNTLKFLKTAVQLISSDPDQSFENKIILSAIRSVINYPILLQLKVGMRPCRDEIRIGFIHCLNHPATFTNYGHGGSGITLCWGTALACSNSVAKHFGIGPMTQAQFIANCFNFLSPNVPRVVSMQPKL